MSEHRNRILIIQTGPGARSMLQELLVDAGIRENDHYLLFQDFNKGFLDSVHNNTPQLVLTSHTEQVDSLVVAEEVKMINAAAVVFAFSSNNPGRSPHLDGMISKRRDPFRSLPLVLNAFLSGKSREDLTSLVRRM